MARAEGPRPLIVVEGREATVDVTVTGEMEYKDTISDALETSLDNFDYELDSGEITLDSAAVLEATHSEDAEQGLLKIDVTLRGQDLSLS
jgi:hypothetical protein